jgi:hypothetical protein
MRHYSWHGKNSRILTTSAYHMDMTLRGWKAIFMRDSFLETVNSFKLHVEVDSYRKSLKML